MYYVKKTPLRYDPYATKLSVGTKLPPQDPEATLIAILRSPMSISDSQSRARNGSDISEAENPECFFDTGRNMMLASEYWITR